MRVLLEDYAGALALHREVLSIRQQLGDRTAMPRSIGAIGEALRRLGHAEEAARLIGAATKLEDELGLARAPTSVRELDASVAQLRAAAGEQAFARAWADGQTLTLEEATERALGESGGIGAELSLIPDPSPAGRRGPSSPRQIGPGSSPSSPTLLPQGEGGLFSASPQDSHNFGSG
jgi:hypothetical protein